MAACHFRAIGYTACRAVVNVTAEAENKMTGSGSQIFFYTEFYLEYRSENNLFNLVHLNLTSLYLWKFHNLCLLLKLEAPPPPPPPPPTWACALA